MAAVPIPPIEFPRTYLKKRLPGTGGVRPNNGGFVWHVSRKSVTYRGPRVATREEAEEGLGDALSALDRGEKPDVAPPRAEDRQRSTTVGVAQFRRELRSTELVEYPPHIRRPQERADRLPCATCQEWRDDGASSEAGRLACGHVAAEAVAHSRPCLFVSCTKTLYLDESQRSGSVKFNHPHLEPSEMGDSCSEDIADLGGVTLDRVAKSLGVVRERVRQVEEKVLRNLKKRTDLTTMKGCHQR